MFGAETIAAIATAPGVGGIGVVRVSGPGVPAVIDGLVGRELTPRLAAFVRFKDVTGATIDEGLALYFVAPHSYTGEDVLEIQGHGGPVVLQRLLNRCVSLGARLADPGEFTRRAYLNDKLDLVQAEAVADLIAARTEQAARSAVRSLSGEFSRLIQSFQDDLTRLRTVLEGALDFPEEGIDFVNESSVAAGLAALTAALDRALRAGEVGKAQQDGLNVVLLGPPNSGKSSIINALCMDDVAIVTPIAGTTRDLVRATIDISGIPVEIVDTAGLRDTSSLVERMGIERSLRAAASADLALLISDASTQHVEDESLLLRVPSSVPRIAVYNKVDLLERLPPAEATRPCEVWVSALTGAGLAELKAAIVAHAGIGTETAFSARTRQLVALRRCRAHVQRAADMLDTLEFAAEELRNAQMMLSEITGEFAADDLLGEIFSSFCIGK